MHGAKLQAFFLTKEAISFCLVDLDVSRGILGATQMADDDHASSSHSHGQLPDFDSNLFVAGFFFFDTYSSCFLVPISVRQSYQQRRRIGVQTRPSTVGFFSEKLT
jgi:hypothetical protein